MKESLEANFSGCEVTLSLTGNPQTDSRVLRLTLQADKVPPHQARVRLWWGGDVNLSPEQVQKVRDKLVADFPDASFRLPEPETEGE